MTKKKISVQEVSNPREKLKDAAYARLWAKSVGKGASSEAVIAYYMKMKLQQKIVCLPKLLIL